MGRVRSLDQLYNTPGLYSSPNMFSPPSERLDHVVRFELTRGCSWGRCTFCGGYDGVKHSVKSPEEYKEHVDQIWKLIGRNSKLACSLKRIFIGGGNALSVGGQTLHELLAYTVEKFDENNDYFSLRRLSLYARTADILKQGRSRLRALHHGDKRLPGVLNLVYWGVESGSDEVLSYVNKRCIAEEMVEAGENLRYAGIDASVMIIPGLGGMKYYDEHVKRTAILLGKIRPRFITFMGVNAGPHTAYTRRMECEVEDGTNRPLTPRETAEQMVEIMETMPTFSTKVGCFNPEIDSVGCNPITFGSYQINDSGNKRYATDTLREWIADRLQS